MKTLRTPRSAHGFTLVELLVVIAIIGLLAAFLFPAIRGAMREAQAGKCRKQVQQLCAGMLQYKDDNDQFFPGSALLKDAGTAKKGLAGGAKGGGNAALDKDRALYASIKDPEVFQCPSDRGSDNPPSDTTDFFVEHGSSYIYAGTDGPGILGLKGDGTDKGRKYTDPFLAASSLKVVFFEPTFYGAAGKPTSNKALWHDSNRASILGFLDGHAEKIRVDTNTKVFGAGMAASAAKAELDKLMESKRLYY